MTFGEHFKKAMDKLDLSDQECADLLGCSRVNVFHIRSDNSKPSFEMLMKILSIKQFKAAFDNYCLENVLQKKIVLTLKQV